MVVKFRFLFFLCIIPTNILMIEGYLLVVRFYWNLAKKFEIEYFQEMN